MGTECQKDYSDEDQQLLDEAEGRECGLPAGVIEREMPAIQVSMETRTIELLQENARNSQERINEARTLSTEGSREGKEEWVIKLEKLDHSRWPSDKESSETARAGRELRISEWSCASLPPITGLGVKDMQPHIKETIAVLSQNEKIWQYRQLWAEPFANKILFADRDALGKEGIVVPEDTKAFTMGAQALYQDKDLPQTIVVFSDKDGKFPEGNELLYHLAHEIAHCNESFEKEDRQLERGENMGWFKPIVGNELEWKAAVEAQVEKGFVSFSSFGILENLEERGGNTEELPDNPHFVHEHFAAWIMDSPNLCDEMRQFFDEFMPKAFGE